MAKGQPALTRVPGVELPSTCRPPLAAMRGRPDRGLGRVPKTLDLNYSGAMTDRPDFFVECITADRALGLGFAIETTPEVATACGASEPGETASGDAPEDVVEAYLHPYGGAEALDGGGARPR